MLDAEDQVMRLLKAYQAAVLSKDVTALIALYDDDVRVFETWGAWVYEGAPAWRATIERWFGSLTTEQVNVTFNNVRAEGESQFILASAMTTFAAISEAGDVLRSMQNRMTWGLARRGEGWKIIHEHTSVPIGFDDLKGILHQNE